MVSVKLKDALQGILSVNECANLVRGYDRLGKVAVIIVPKILEEKESAIAKALLENIKGLRTVAKRIGYYTGEYRKIPLKILAGQRCLDTVHREYGINLYLDLEKVYFSPRSSGERYRLARMVKPDERVLIMFSGIAPLPLMIARYSEAQEIHAIEKNPEAHVYASKNVKTNRWAKNITLHEGDVTEVMEDNCGLFERIALMLPSGGADFLPLALGSLVERGWLHYYDFQKKGEFARAEDTVRKNCEGSGRKVMSTVVHKCGHVSPGKYRICVDAQVY